MNASRAELQRAVEATGLPLLPRLPDVARAAAPHSGGVAVLRAEPGSGKSTLVPLALAAAAPEGTAGASGKVLMLEPRRVAAVGVASRMADLAGDEVGGLVGYSVRMERRVSRRTAVEVVTEGLLSRRLVEDSSLEGVGTVIFDEFHERSVHADLALALLLDLRVLRPDLSILIMSATLDAGRLVDFLSDAIGEAVASIDCPGRPFPVAVEYAPLGERRRAGTGAGEAVLRELAGPGEGDILVFLPGRREIDDAAEVVRRGIGPGAGVEVLVLHGGIPLDRQRAIVRPAARGPGSPRSGAARRVILSTNIAQTSLTVPGVATVIDTGLVRLQRRHAASGMDRLVLEAASEADCDQRAGRAGRLGPGRCVRLWAPGDPRPRETECEILRTELSPLVLDCALWGAASPLSLMWLDPPTEAGVEDAAELLRELGALDGEGRPTERGRRMARLGVHPRLAALALDGAAPGPGAVDLGAVSCVAAAALSDRDGSGLRDDADFLRRLSILRGERDGDASGPGVGAWVERVRESARDLRSRLGGGGLFFGPAEQASLPALLAAAFPDRIARRQGSGLFRVPAGREFRVDGPLSREEWLVVPEADAGERSGVARLAAALAPEDAERVLAASYPEARAERTRIEWDGLVPRSFSCRRAGRLVLSERRVKTDSAALPDAFAELLAERGLAILPWDSKGASPAALLARIRFWSRRGGPGTAFDDDALAAEAAEWLGPFLRADGGAVVDSAALREALRARLGYRDAAELDRVVPEALETPAGTRRKLEYAGDDVFLDARIQEVFGLSETPRVLGAPVTLRLLSPAERPLQTTRDLASFWKGTYAEVRKEMRGRYPRHYWPEDPLIAEPTSRPKPRGT